MNLSGIFNHPELNRSQSASQNPASLNPSNSSTAAVGQPNGGKTDQTSLSAGALAAAAQSHDGGSDVRLDKVASVSAALQAGTYSVSPYHVADKIMQGMFENGSR